MRDFLICLITILAIHQRFYEGELDAKIEQLQLSIDKMSPTYTSWLDYVRMATSEVLP